MAIQKNLTLTLYPTQYDFVFCPSRFAGFISGIGAGKSHAGAAKAVKACYEIGGLGLVIAPTYPMLRDATLRTFTSVAGDLVQQVKHSEMLVTMKGGAEVIFRSADNPDRLRGPNISWLWIDEAALCPAQTWEIAIGRLREGGKAGPAWITGTPKGRNWVYNLMPRLTMFRVATADNPYLDREFVRSLEESYTGLFAKQELLGEFVSFEGLVYDEFDRSRHVQQRQGPWQRVIAGVDEGFTNPAVILVIGLDGDGRAHLVEEFYQRRMLQADVVSEARRLWQAYHISTFYADPSAAGLIAEMQSVNLPVQSAINDVFPGIQHIKGRLAQAGDGRPRLTLDPSAVNTIAELESYIWKQGKAGVKDEPEKVNDHAMDALRYPLFSDESQAMTGSLFL
jgi:PBSX family phage terminase large subunit